MFSDMMVGQRMSSVSITVKLGLAGTLAVAIALGIGRFAYTPILPYMQNELYLSSTELGALASWSGVGRSSTIIACIGGVLDRPDHKASQTKRAFFLPLNDSELELSSSSASAMSACVCSIVSWARKFDTAAKLQRKGGSDVINS